jgi:hypothetical protein
LQQACFLVCITGEVALDLRVDIVGYHFDEQRWNEIKEVRLACIGSRLSLPRAGCFLERGPAL